MVISWFIFSENIIVWFEYVEKMIKSDPNANCRELAIQAAHAVSQVLTNTDEW